MLRLIAILLIVSLLGCATTQGNIPQGTEAEKKYDCSRLEAAWIAYNRVLSPVEMTKKAIDECNHSDPMVCLIIPIVPPFTALCWIFGLPILFPVFIISPYVRETVCPKKTAEVSTDSAISGDQQN